LLMIFITVMIFSVCFQMFWEVHPGKVTMCLCGRFLYHRDFDGP
jgi:hypothetical protein